MFNKKINGSVKDLNKALGLACKLSFMAAFFSPLSAWAQEAGKWEYRASIYGYSPTASGTTNFPSGGGNSGATFNSEPLQTDYMFMGTVAMHNGNWGLFCDFIRFDLDAGTSRTNDFSLTNGGSPISIPGGTSADFDMHLKAKVWSLAGEYRVISTPAVKMDVLAGTRMIKLESNTNWNISGSLGSWNGARSDFASVSRTFWDGIVGVKGNVALGNSAWSVPYYFDLGTGSSKLTWQAATGIAYTYNRIEFSAMWRYLDYELKSDSSFQDVNFSGPMIGATFKF